MELQTAIELIRIDPLYTLPVTWADLGCGTGLFTQALASQFPARSKIYAVDQNRQSLQRVPLSDTVTIEKIQADFIHDRLPLQQLDGILMANALHFVKDKPAFFDLIRRYCKPSHHLLVVEYDMNTSNSWVPYPVDFSTLENLCKKAGYASVRRIYDTPSVYNRASIYGTMIST